MNTEKNWRWSEVGPEPRTAGRRFVETDLRRDHARASGASPKRIYILETGYAMLDKEFDQEVRRDLAKDLFKTLGHICRPLPAFPTIRKQSTAAA